ncbi:MAG: DinB family protein [Planctomycetota bacterium]
MPRPPDLDACIARLEPFPAVVHALVGGVTADEARRRGAEGQWAVVEVVNHLADEEAEDFRQRLQLTLDDPDQRWPDIDPAGSAAARGYIDRDLAESLDRFAQQRRMSIDWLRTLDVAACDWSAVHPHRPWPITAGDLLASWLAHDMLHLRQLAKRLYEIGIDRAGGGVALYAGDPPGA